jgi:hypothetical protein
MPRVVYEITEIVRADLAAEYERFMRDEHIPDLLATGQFCGAKLMADGNGSFRIAYESKSQANLDRYLAEFAPDLRQKFLDRFPLGVDVSRAEWKVVENWEC